MGALLDSVPLSVSPPSRGESNRWNAAGRPDLTYATNPSVWTRSHGLFSCGCCSHYRDFVLEVVLMRSALRVCLPIQPGMEHLHRAAYRLALFIYGETAAVFADKA
jgi:hypothetical protein